MLSCNKYLAIKKHVVLVTALLLRSMFSPTVLSQYAVLEIHKKLASLSDLHHYPPKNL